MGEIADDILNGDIDEQTGEWLGDGQGFPRSINRPKTVFKKKKKAPSPIKGVVNYLGGKYVSKELMYKVIKDYLCIEKIESTGDLLDDCTYIQKDFGKFVKYINGLNGTNTKSTAKVEENLA